MANSATRGRATAAPRVATPTVVPAVMIFVRPNSQYRPTGISSASKPCLPSPRNQPRNVRRLSTDGRRRACPTSSSPKAADLGVFNGDAYKRPALCRCGHRRSHRTRMGFTNATNAYPRRAIFPARTVDHRTRRWTKPAGQENLPDTGIISVAPETRTSAPFVATGSSSEKLAKSATIPVPIADRIAAGSRMNPAYVHRPRRTSSKTVGASRRPCSPTSGNTGSRRAATANPAQNVSASGQIYAGTRPEYRRRGPGGSGPMVRCARQ